MRTRRPSVGMPFAVPLAVYDTVLSGILFGASMMPVMVGGA
jgi:hypothetical protein